MSTKIHCKNCDENFSSMKKFNEHAWEPLPVTKKADWEIKKEISQICAKQGLEVRQAIHVIDETFEILQQELYDELGEKRVYTQSDLSYHLYEQRNHLLNAFTRMVGRIESSLEGASAVKDSELLVRADIEELLEDVRLALKKLREEK